MPLPLFKPIQELSTNTESAFRLPAKRRLTLEASRRLFTITESNNAKVRPASTLIPTSNTPPPKPMQRSILGTNVSTNASSLRTAPPSYKSHEWISEGLEGGENGHEPVEGEKLAKLRREGEEGRRGGRVGVILIAVIVLVVLALAIGLGVGLTTGKKKDDANGNLSTASQPGGTSEGPDSTQPFPLGEHSLVTVLRSVQTDCTSNPATWRCYPYSAYNPTNSADTSSRTTFNWIISNTSTTFASPDSTPPTAASGVPANLTISSTNNPFVIPFANESLTYISTADNITSPRLTFSFSMSKNVVPSPAITPDSTQSQCFFNSTVFTGILYLSAERSYPAGDAANDPGIGGYEQWPYAVEIAQSSPGGQSIPTCYETVSGGIRDGITVGVDPQPSDRECACVYQNFGLG